MPGGRAVIRDEVKNLVFFLFSDQDSPGVWSPWSVGAIDLDTKTLVLSTRFFSSCTFYRSALLSEILRDFGWMSLGVLDGRPVSEHFTFRADHHR